VSAPADQNGTVAYADHALRRLKALGASGDPRNFAAWFTYATGCSPSQNAVVNDRLKEKGNISAPEIENIYGYAPPDAGAGRAEALAVTAIDEMRKTVAAIDAAASVIAGYGDELLAIAGKLDGMPDRATVTSLVEELQGMTRSMQARNDAFLASLQVPHREMREVRRKANELRCDRRSDALTGLANRAFFEGELNRSLAGTDGSTLCLLLLDIDRLATINEAFGQTVGDEILRVVSHSLRQHLQPNDVAARIGPETFAVLLPATRPRSALTVADHVRHRVMGMHFTKRSTGESMGRVTLSGGVASYRAGETPWALLRRADTCVGAAKRNGGNRVIADTDALAGAA